MGIRSAELDQRVTRWRIAGRLAVDVVELAYEVEELGDSMTLPPIGLFGTVFPAKAAFVS